MTAASGISHLGIGVSDIDRSVTFYTEVLGCELLSRHGYYVPADPTLVNFGNAKPDAEWWREVALLRMGQRPEDPVIVMSLTEGTSTPQRVEIDDVGTHHWAMWVTGIEDYVARVDRAGMEWCVPLRTFSARNWGLPETVQMKTCIFRDPDGTIIQLDELVPTT